MRLILVLPLLLTACGPFASEKSNLNWVQSRPQDSRYARLLEEDFTDSFIFGLQTIEVVNAPTNLIEFASPSRLVTLKVKGSELSVSTQDGSELLTFDLNPSESGRYEVDFASPHNLLSVEGGVSGQAQRISPQVTWTISQGPQLAGLVQTPDLVLVDLKYNVTRAQGAEAGHAIVRLSLVRQKSLGLNETTKTVADGLSRNLGFIGAGATLIDTSGKIRTFDIRAQERVTVYLKDFPEKYRDIGTKAVLAWNAAFPSQVLEVKEANATIDVGDPRYNVIKWLPNADSTVPWAATAAPAVVDPTSGHIVSGGVFVNGGTQRAVLAKVIGITKDLNEEIDVKFGGIALDREPGEVPVLPDFFLKPDAAVDDILAAVYAQTLTHEVGHMLGLRHNLKGSLNPANGLTDSVMDYLPLKESIALGSTIGAYDIDAIRWAYLGLEPSVKRSFCSDLDQMEQWDCNPGDLGNPLEYFSSIVQQTMQLLVTMPSASLQNYSFGTLGTAFSGGLKFFQYRQQMPVDFASRIDTEVAPALLSVCDPQPSKSLSSSDANIVRANIALMKTRVRAQLSDPYIQFTQPWLMNYKQFIDTCFPPK